jgi:hypothetical protein
MARIVDVNWDNFKAKFSGSKQAAFERFCYILFCKEFAKEIGIFRFRNHAGIETNPIENEGKVIGWQAKFYETRLSDSQNKNDIKHSIDFTKKRHPEVNKIIFYTNQEFGQDAKKTDPQYKIDLESYAKSKNIDIEWRTASYFESPFVCEQNFSVAEHFFSLKRGILDSITELQASADSILKPIHSEISFGENKIKLDRSAIVGGIKDTVLNSPLVILSGGGGVGKTAVIKDLYESVKKYAPFFVFKVTQFNGISHVNQIFRNYGEIASQEFINEHSDTSEKYVVFDAAERLSEIKNQDVFRVFFSDLVEHGWRVLFTVRHGYLDDLRFQLKEFYGANFTSLNIPTLTIEKIEEMSKEYKFLIPTNERLANLLLIPLYLNVYLQNYADINENTSYTDFREIIWRRQIQNSSYQLNNLHRRREECFLNIARQRANDGGFFVKTNEADHEALHELESGEIIQYDSNAGGYFITHDIYEEWGLDKIIERIFFDLQDYQEFYCRIGSSLPIRRAFRNWLSDKLFANNENAKRLIEFTIQSNQIDNHWKDEVLVSVLLSDYSKVFFDRFEDDLLKEASQVGLDHKCEETTLYKIIFLLRISCKTINEDFLNSLGLKRTSEISLKTVFTIPKGSGWNSTISFINNHKEKLQLKYLNIILPVLDDWNLSHKQGQTTKDASQIALFYYDLLMNQGFYFSSRNDTGNQLIRVILNGSSEIKSELAQIINQIVATGDTSHRSKYYELCRTMLSSIIDSSEVSKHLPQEVMKLANFFWFDNSSERDPYSHSSLDIEQHFGLLDNHMEYYPSSAFKTPLFILLQDSPQEAAAFILSFTNKSIEFFAQSEFAKYEVETVDVGIDHAGSTIKQYICNRIWNIYRGTQVSPSLLESMHMALEKWLLMIAKTAPAELLEQWCLYLIKNSCSASITAVVVSVVLAEPSKLFNVAEILFRTKDFFSFDSTRMQLDMSAKSIYSISYDSSGVFQTERLQTCKDKHRAHSLENQALSYQLFATEDEGEKIANQRQEVIWKIFDEYYAKLPDAFKETENDKTWKLCLARMDRRKMAITTEEKDDQIFIKFNPEIDLELKQYSENAFARSSEVMKYLPLQLWSRNKFERKEDAKKYSQYEDDYSLALLETKEILDQLQTDKRGDGQFTLFYRSVPSYVCAVLLREYFDKLQPQDAEFCKNVILERGSAPLTEVFQCQVGDGFIAAVNTLPLLLKRFPKDSERIKEILLFLLFDSYPIGMNQQVSDCATFAILQHLGKECPHDVNALLYGYLLLKPKFDDITDSVRENKTNNKKPSLSKASIMDRFKEKWAAEFSKFTSNQLAYNDIVNIAEIDPATLVTAFLLVPLRTTDANHKQFLKDVIPVLIKLLQDDNREKRRDYSLEPKFLKKFSYFVLSSKKEEIPSYVQPFTQLIGVNYKNTRVAADILNEFIFAEDVLNQYNEFWIVWQIFYPKITELCSHESLLRDCKSTIYNYLLAVQWKEGAKEWHSLKDREKLFFKKVSEDLGSNGVVLYAIAKLLNDVGSNFASDGIFWVSNILQKTPDLTYRELPINTVYYLENFVRGYIIKNRQRIKTESQLKAHILVILNFLIEKASVTAYMLREDIL